MTVYRLEGILHPSVKITSKINETDPPHYRRAFVDSYSLACLNRLVTGPITTLSELRAAELAARAIIFHDDINILMPSIDHTHIGALESQPFHGTRGITEPDISAIQDLVREANLHTHLIPVDRVTTFGDEAIKRTYIEQYEHRKEQQAQRAVELEKMGIPKPIELVNIYNGTFVPICESIDQLYDQVFLNSQEQIINFLTALPATGSPAYIGEPTIGDVYEGKSKDVDYRAFFSEVDKEWVERLDRHANYAFRVPLGFMLSIALAESATRNELPTVLLQIRREFSNAREQLWASVDDALLRSVTETDAARILDPIEDAMREIIPASFRANDCWFPIRFSYLKRLLMFDFLGLMKDVADSVESALQINTSNLHMVDAAGMLVEHIKNVPNLRWLVERHFSDLEISSLRSEIER